ncbi:hypothetical protein SAMN05216378_1310 [Paenibacillus catalpae]|uniref:Uncharacterized protein n=1 Tax=Paenibacillus catalpae TaxID=1045775 RepID=A0A1I1UZU6_9BACL|nr:hypothetical protein [Paenibacillus catalpae]SFD76149.1 hypothetical protein SAMN05216378_1310 [Paenibacillus catalpae]
MIVIEISAFVMVMLGWSIIRVQKFRSLNQPNAAVLYSCLMGICAISGSLLIAHVPLPSTTTPLRIIFEPFGEMILQQ